jgi:hypothetical protein
MHGLLVALEYQRHVSKKKRLDPKVFEYNEDDVRSLPFIIEKVNDGIKVEKRFLRKAGTRVKREIPDEMKEEIALLRTLRSEGYTLQQLAEKFDRSVYYIYSRLNSKYRPGKSTKSLGMRISRKELIDLLRESYEEFGRMSIRRDKRYRCYNVDVRFYAKTLDELVPLRKAMSLLGFSEGSPYVSSKKRRCYIPYYGKQQAIRFVRLVKPRKKNDISKIL